MYFIVAVICSGKRHLLHGYSSFVLIVLMLHKDTASVTSGQYDLLELKLCNGMPTKVIASYILHLSNHSSLIWKYFCYQLTESNISGITIIVSALYVTLALSTV